MLDRTCLAFILSVEGMPLATRFRLTHSPIPKLTLSYGGKTFNPEEKIRSFWDRYIKKPD